MAKKRRNKESIAEENKVQKQEERVEEVIVLESIDEIDEAKGESDSSSCEEKKDIEDAIENAVKEYNGEVKEETLEEKQIRIRDKADVAKLSKINKKAIVVSISIIFALLISFVAIAIVNKMNTNVYRNIYLNGKNVTAMTNAEIADYLKTVESKLNNQTLKIMQDDQMILEVMPTDINFEIDIEKVQEDVFGYGRNSNIIKNNIDIIYALICKKEFDLTYKYDVAKLADVTKEIKESLDGKVINDSYVVDENQYKLIITKGKSGNTIEEEYVKNQIVSGLINQTSELKLEIVKGKPEELDLDVIYSQVRRDAKDAYIDKTASVYKFVPHIVGLDFNKDDLKKVLSNEENKQDGKVIEFELKVIEPKVKTSDINWEMYDYKVSSYTTYFSTSDPNRVNNLRVALNLLNGKVIMPGEIFSFNNVVGAVTAAQGFKAASTFVGGRIVREIGGGICQTVSTLYNTALYANLEIVQRKAHSLPVAYVPESRDATVYYPSIDFKFKNTREYPIKIVTSFNSSGSLTISIYGTKQENEYVISISSRKLSTIKFSEQSTTDSTLEKGKVQVVQAGSNGYTSEAYITKKLNGKIVSTTLLSRDTYKAVNKIVKIGTKEVYVEPAPAPTPAPTPTPVPSQPNDGGNTENDNQVVTPETPDGTN